MAKLTQSIEDLIAGGGAPAGHAPGPEATVQEKFEEKMRDVRLRELEDDARRQASLAGVQYVNLKGFPISPEAISQIPKEQAASVMAVCFLYSGSEFRIGAVNPADPRVKELEFQVAERLQANGGVYKISDESLRAAIKMYDVLPKIKLVVKGVKVTDDELKRFRDELTTFADIQRVLGNASVTDIMTIIMAAAIQFNTSDVHVEAEEKRVGISFRVDGVLQDVAELPHDFWKKIISRIKLISGLKINVTDRPQDGRFTIFLKEGDTDVRVSTIPTNWGESVVMRILRPGSIAVEFAGLGLRPAAEKKLVREIEKPHGMIITTGPTGSGKTTTLYAVLRRLNSPDVKIITLEDPVEYKLEGINQSQIDHSKQYTFASGLRSILRQDPDIVMVGEIRDLETAETAINAALTGHMMLSTLHTNDAAGALPRFISMGVKPFLLAPALNAIIGQRLARKIHQDCKEPLALDAETLERVKKILLDMPPNSGETMPPPEQWSFYRGKGCEACNGTGYKGRVGIYEILLMTDQIRAALSESVDEYQVRQLAKAQGMATMQQDGMLKALDGMTAVEEVLRVAGEGG
jgi:type IV pilus assembly protein PilB